MLTQLIAHGVGSRGTLPLPLWQFSWAAIVALVLSFGALGALWKSPKLDASAPARVLSGTRPALKALEWLIRAVGLLLFGLTLGAGLFGENVGGESVNLAPVTIYVMVWVAVPIVSALVGDIWKWCNPFETFAILFEQFRPAPEQQPPSHQWVAVATLVGFLFLELVHPSGDLPQVLGWSMLVYALVQIGGIIRFGHQWLDRADGFGVLFTAIAAMSPFTTVDGHVAVRRPLSGLSSVRIVPGTTMLILVVLGGTSFDGFSESPIFTDIIGRPTGWAAALPKSIGLFVMIAIAAILYWFGARATAAVTGLSHDDAADMFAPALIPIVWAYAVAHYAQLLVDQAQSFWFRLSNPYGSTNADGSPALDLFGGAEGVVDLTIINPDIVAWVQAISIVLGHALAVIYAHDIAVRHFDHKVAARSQQTMLIVMVLYSVAGLWLLFAG